MRYDWRWFVRRWFGTVVWVDRFVWWFGEDEDIDLVLKIARFSLHFNKIPARDQFFFSKPIVIGQFNWSKANADDRPLGLQLTPWLQDWTGSHALCPPNAERRYLAHCKMKLFSNGFCNQLIWFKPEMTQKSDWHLLKDARLWLLRALFHYGFPCTLLQIHRIN